MISAPLPSPTRLRRCALAVVLIGISRIVSAQVPAAAPTLPAAASNAVTPVTPVAAASALDPAEVSARVALPAVAASTPAQTLRQEVIEDDNVRIEETRLRGLPQRITVRNKSGGGSSYEILVGPKGKDASSSDKGTSGRSAWSLFDF